MSSNYPTSIQSFSNPTATDLLENATAALDHDYQHTTENDTLFALQTKCGVDGSAVNTTFDFKLSAISGGQKALTSGTSTQSVTNLTLVTPVVTLGGDATGDMYYRNGSGAFVRLAIGSAGQILNVTGGIPAWIANPSASDASTTVKGVVEIATAAEITAGTATGTTGAPLAVTPDALLASSYGALGTSLDKILFGDGSDGAVVISGNTTLTRDMYYTNLTINSGVTLTTGNFRIFGTGTLTNNNATNGIVSNGGNGADGGASAGGTGGTCTSGSVRGGATGGTGGNGARGGGGGGAGGGTVWIAFKNVAVQGGIQALGGNGGNGYTISGGGGYVAPTSGGSMTASLITTGTAGDGGAAGGGVVTNAGTLTSSKQSSKNVLLMYSLMDNALSLGMGGGAAGGGGGGNATQAGGGGGGMGGVIVFMYRTITTSGTLTVTGGTGGTGTGGGSNGGNGSAGLAVSLVV